MNNIKSEDEQIVDILFCGIKDEPCTEPTKDWTSILEGEEKQCDEVCELFGGPPTRFDMVRTFFIIKLSKIKIFLHKILYIKYRGSIRKDGYEEYSSFISIYLLGRQVFFRTWINAKGKEKIKINFNGNTEE